MFYLDDVQTDVLVEGIQDQFTQPTVAPRPMNQQKLLKEAELKNNGVRPYSHQTHQNITYIYASFFFVFALKKYL